jgi:hypothetical protein
MDYRFAIRCWQDQAGDENAKANVFVDGVQVLTEVEVTATSADSPQLITWESTGLTAPAADTSFDIKVVLVNNYYVDANTDRNIIIDGIGYINKNDDGDYALYKVDATVSPVIKTNTIITDFTDIKNYANAFIPTAVTGDQIASDWWANRDEDTFYKIYVWGGDAGATMTFPVVSVTY